MNQIKKMMNILKKLKDKNQPSKVKMMMKMRKDR